MSKSAFLNLNLRVCGSETVRLLATSTGFFIDGWSAGNPATMAEATRYLVIP